MLHGIYTNDSAGNHNILIARYDSMDIANETREQLNVAYPDANFIVQQCGHDEAIIVTDFIIPEQPTSEPDENEFPDDAAEDDETNSFPSDETNQKDSEA